MVRGYLNTATRYNTLQHSATLCNILQCTVAYCCTTLLDTLLKCIATHCNTLQTHVATHCNTLQQTATHSNILQHTATYYNNTLQHTLQHTTPHCTTLHHTATHLEQMRTPNMGCGSLNTATHCNTLQHTATHCNTLQTHCDTHCNILYRPFQPIIHVLLQVNRFQKSLSLIVQYNYLKSCPGDFILQNLILRTRSRGTVFITTQSSWVFHFHPTIMVGWNVLYHSCTNSKGASRRGQPFNVFT